MSEAPIDVRLSADASGFVEPIRRTQQRMLLLSISRAMMIALANGYELVRIVVGLRLARRLADEAGSSFGPIRSIYGVPAVVDENARDGFGLVTRPPAT